MTEEPRQNDDYLKEKLVYDIMNVPLTATYDEKKLELIAKYIFILQIPIEVKARINDMENEQVNLATVRAIKGNITRLYITTTSTSTTVLKILASNADFFSLLSFGDVVKLIDTSNIEYDARVAKHDVQTVYNLMCGDGVAHDTDVVDIQTYRDFLITVDNSTDVNYTIKYLVSSDGVKWFQLEENSTINTGMDEYQTFNEAWSFFKVNYQGSAGATSGLLTIKLERRS